MTPRVPPQDILAEKVVLGAMLMTSEIIPEIASVLDSKDFYYPSHCKIYEAILSLWNQQQPVDLITVSSALHGQVNTADISDMADNALPSHAKVHARLVKEAAQKRRLLDAIRESEEELYSSTDGSLSVAGRLSSVLSRLQDGGPRNFVHVAGVMAKTVKQIEQAYEQKDPITGVPTGLNSLDLRLGGIHPGELWVIAGRPGMGKTALAATIAKGAAERGYGVAFVTAEAPAPKITQRLLSEAMGIENRDLRRGRLNYEDFKTLPVKSKAIGNLPLWFLDSDRSWDRIKAKLRGLKLREQGLSLVVIDYVGLLSAPVPKGERYLEVGRISSEAKALAIELEIGILLLSQLNREVEGRPDKKPRLSDMRDSGSLEQDPDVVGLLYREAYYNQDARQKELAVLDIAKNRDGITGEIKLTFKEETVSFSD